MAGSIQNIGEILRKKRLENHLTQEQFAEMTGVTAGFIGQVERGEAYPSIRIFANMVEILELDTNKIFHPFFYESDDHHEEISIQFEGLNHNHRELVLTLMKKLAQIQKKESTELSSNIPQ